MRNTCIAAFLFCLTFGFANAQEIRKMIQLESDWKFSKGDFTNAHFSDFNDSDWQTVKIPHDWAIFGPFDENNDIQELAIKQNLETKVSKQTGRTGGLPYMGIGWYRKKFNIDDFNPENNIVSILFDGAMSEARIFLNGKEVGFWPNGYNSFHFDITKYLNKDGKNNHLAVRLENKEQSSRWYPGAGLYRNVHLIITNKIHVPVWGTYITTPYATNDFAMVKLKTKLANLPEGEEVKFVTVILNKEGKEITEKTDVRKLNFEQEFEQNFIVDTPELWSPENPVLYKALSKIYYKDTLVDKFITRFGIRDIRFIADRGFYLNGVNRKFQGVCLHHDLGPLGAAVNTSAIRRQLTILKDMGCDAIRTSHNIPAPELVALCDEMGFMMIVESFDEWDNAKCTNGYHRFFDDWAEKDMINMIHNYRNNPSVVMWSIGNEVPTQCDADGYKVAKYLQDICHKEDPTRPVTCGMDQVSCVLKNGFAGIIDIPGFNYRTNRYVEAYNKLPQNLLLGSETASTVSSRGVYKFPVITKANALYADNQSSSYDTEYCSWSNLPEEDFALAEDYPWTLGQFVWTGFDYLGEPTPYSIDSWPNHSSMFGIVDLAGIPKDRYYLYRSIWNNNNETLHVLPHWNWEGKEGDTIPVYVYTNHPQAEIFINGKSYGIKEKSKKELKNRYRLIWDNVIYEPGELKVVAYNKDGFPITEKKIITAQKPYKIELSPDRSTIKSDGTDLVFVNVKIVDQQGNFCPNEQRLVKFSVEGAGHFRAAANGDPTCLNLFHLPEMPLFNGQLTVVLQANETKGEIVLRVSAENVKSEEIKINVE
jgi:beta-galactosidase